MVKKNIISIYLRSSLIVFISLTAYFFFLFFSKNVPLSWDDSFFMLVSRNVAFIGHYGTMHKLFDPSITVGFPVILPTALIFKVLSMGPFQERLATCAYLVGFLNLVYFLPRKVRLLSVGEALLCLGLFVVLSFTNVANLLLLVFNAYGEIPALFFYFLALLYQNTFFLKRRYGYLILSGIFLGLSISTKYIMIFAAISSLMTCMMFFRLSWKKSFIGVICLITGILIPVFAFEFYHLIRVGIPQYIVDVGDLVRYYGNVDLELFDIRPISQSNFLNHLHVLRVHGFNVIAPFLFVITSIYLIVASIKSKNYILVNICCMFVFVFIYFFFISHNLLIRHLSIAIIGFNFAVALFVVSRASKIGVEISRKKGIAMFEFVILILFAALFSSPGIFKANTRIIDYQKAVGEQKKISAFISNSGVNNVYYDRYDRTPEIEFLSKKMFLWLPNRSKHISNGKTKDFLIMTQLRLRTDPDGYNRLKNQYCKRVLRQTYYYLVCRM